MTKKYLVVGGTSGIGRALTEQLTKRGDEVMVASRNTPEPNDLVDAKHLSFDARSSDALDIDWDTLDGLAYCPGSINLKPFHRLKPEDFQSDWDINLMGAVRVIQQMLPKLKKSASASIVLFSTVAVQQGMSFHASIAASKGAIEGLTRSLAAELSPAIRVNCIAPSIVNTSLAGRLLSSEEKIEASAKKHPLHRVGQADDIAYTAAHLLSDHSGWMTGQILAVDGGMSSVKML